MEQRKPFSYEQILEELRELRKRISEMEKDVSLLKMESPPWRDGVEAFPGPVPPLTAPEEPPQAPFEPDAASGEERFPIVLPEGAPPFAAASSPAPAVPTPAPAVPTKPIPLRPAPRKEGQTLEQVIGTRWMLIVGVALVILSGVFFFQYARQQGWITPLHRLIAGALFGLAMLGTGEWFIHKKMKLFAAGLIGAGIVWLYQTVFMASPNGLFEDLRMLSAPASFGLMCAVTAMGVGLSLQTGMLLAAVISLVGAMATPALLSTGRNEQVLLMSYLLVVDAGFLVVAFVRRWEVLCSLSLLGTILLFGGWFLKYYDSSVLTATCAFGWAFAGLFWGYTCAAVATARISSRLGELFAGAPAATMGVLLLCAWGPPGVYGKAIGFFQQVLAIDAVLLALCLWRRWLTLPLCALGGTILAVGVWMALSYDSREMAATAALNWALLVLFGGYAVDGLVRGRLTAGRAGTVVALGSVAMAILLATICRASQDLHAFAVQLLVLAGGAYAFARWRKWAVWSVVQTVLVAVFLARWVAQQEDVAAEAPLCVYLWCFVAMVFGVLTSWRDPKTDRYHIVNLLVASVLLIGAWICWMESIWPWGVALQLLVLDLVVLGVCLWRRWHGVRAGLLAWTALVLLVFGLHVRHEPNWHVIGWIWVFFAVMTIDILIRAWWKRVETREWLDAILASAAIGMMFAGTYYSLRHVYPDWMGGYAALLGVAALATAPLVRYRAQCRRLAYTYLGQGLVLVTMAVPIHFDRSPMIVTISWAVQGLVLMLLARRVAARMLLIASPAVLVLSLLHFFLRELPTDPHMADVLVAIGGVNLHYSLLLAMILTAAVLAATAILRAGGPIVTPDPERALAICLSLLAAGVYLSRTWIELPVLAATWWWAAVLVALMALAAVRRSSSLTVASGMVLLAATAKFLFFDTLRCRMEGPPDLALRCGLNWQFALALVLAAAIVAAMTLFRCQWKSLHGTPAGWSGLRAAGSLLAAGLIAWAGSLEIDRYFLGRWHGGNTAMQMSYSLWWGLWATVVLVVGFVRGNAPLRYFAILLYGMTIVKVFLVDMKDVQQVYRILSFMGFGILLLAGSWLYHRAFRKGAEQKSPPPADPGAS